MQVASEAACFRVVLASKHNPGLRLHTSFSIAPAQQCGTAVRTRSTASCRAAAHAGLTAAALLMALGVLMWPALRDGLLLLLPQFYQLIASAPVITLVNGA